MIDNEVKGDLAYLNESLWDDEFPGNTDMSNRERFDFEATIKAGEPPHFASLEFLRKVQYIPKPGAVIQAVRPHPEGQLIPVYSVTDICRAPEYIDPRIVRTLNFHPPKQRGYSKKWRGKWITKTELHQHKWLNKSGLKYFFALSERWIERLEAWLAEQDYPVRLQTNPNHPKWTPMRLYEKDAVETLIGLNASELMKK